MSKEGIRKVKEGLVLLIDGLLENTNGLIELSDEEIVKSVIGHNIDKIKDYIQEAKHCKISEEKIYPLEIRYKFLKAEYKKIK